MDYLHTGQNTIAIATVAFTASQSTSYFDCAMRLMATDEESRVMEFDVASSSSISYASNVFSKVYTNAIGMTTCDSNYLEVTFQNDKREWISSIILTNKYNDVKANVKAVTVKARNYDSEQWGDAEVGDGSDVVHGGSASQGMAEQQQAVPHLSLRELWLGIGDGVQLESPIARPGE